MDGQQNGGTTRPMTFEEIAVGLTFNPGNNPDVDKIKTLYAKVIDELNEMSGEDRKTFISRNY